jgi:1,4-alpha-glucan branching enzyme
MLPPCAFVSFLQNHDQVGNRAFGERIGALADEPAVRAAAAVVLLAPPPPLVFMGEEFASRQPFQFFSDFGADIAAAVTAGRRREFARFARFAEPAARESIPDPNAAATYERSKLDWDSLLEAAHHDWLVFYRRLLRLRREQIVPRLAGMPGGAAVFRQLGETGLQVRWRLGDGAELVLLTNLGAAPLPVTAAQLPAGEPLYAEPASLAVQPAAQRLPPWSVLWSVHPGTA